MRSFKNKLVFITGIVFISLCLQLSGCASDSYASKGAKQGAAQGAAAGAVGGLVSALVFGGDPLDRAARGAVYGGTAGAVAGGMAGSRKDKQVQAQRDASLEALRNEIGADAFEGLASLAECRHPVTLNMAAKAQQSDNPNFRLAGLWLEVLSYADSRQEERARNLLPVIVTEDWDIKTVTQAEQAMRQAVGELSAIRKEYSLPLVCPA